MESHVYNSARVMQPMSMKDSFAAVFGHATSLRQACQYNLEYCKPLMLLSRVVLIVHMRGNKSRGCLPRTVFEHCWQSVNH